MLGRDSTGITAPAPYSLCLTPAKRHATSSKPLLFPPLSPPHPPPRSSLLAPRRMDATNCEKRRKKEGPSERNWLPAAAIYAGKKGGAGGRVAIVPCDSSENRFEIDLILSSERHFRMHDRDRVVIPWKKIKIFFLYTLRNVARVSPYIYTHTHHYTDEKIPELNSFRERERERKGKEKEMLSHVARSNNTNTACTRWPALPLRPRRIPCTRCTPLYALISYFLPGITMRTARKTKEAGGIVEGRKEGKKKGRKDGRKRGLIRVSNIRVTLVGSRRSQNGERLRTSQWRPMGVHATLLSSSKSIYPSRGTSPPRNNSLSCPISLGNVRVSKSATSQHRSSSLRVYIMLYLTYIMFTACVGTNKETRFH